MKTMKAILLIAAVMSVKGQCDLKGKDTCEENLFECQWGGSMGCIPQVCNGLAEAACKSQTGCRFNLMCMPTTDRYMCATGPDCLTKNYCTEATDGKCSMLDVPATCDAESTIVNCAAGNPCDWDSGKCVDFQCFFRMDETACNQKVGCSYDSTSTTCTRVPTSPCSERGTVECMGTPKCGIDASTTNNDCIECTGLDQTKCSAVELCEWSGTACSKRRVCESFTQSTDCVSNKCYWDPVPGGFARCVDADGTPACKDMPVVNCTMNYGCEESQGACVNKQVPVNECINLDPLTCDFYSNCTYSVHSMSCVASDRCSSQDTCASVANCQQIGKSCAVVANKEDETCTGYKLQGQCDPDDKCVWTNNECRFMVGCAASTESTCLTKSSCQWLSKFNICTRKTAACSTINFRTACNGGPCEGVNSLYMDTIVSLNYLYDGAYTPEIEIKSLITYQSPRGIACIGNDCDICAPGHILNLDVKVSCPSEGGEATLVLSGSRVCIPAYGDVPVTPTTAVPGSTPTTTAPVATEIPGAATATPVPGAATATPVPGAATATPVPGAATATPVPGAATATPVPGAATATPVPGAATATPVPGAATATPVPGAATATPVPGVAAATPVPGVATATPVPNTMSPAGATATPVPDTAAPNGEPTPIPTTDDDEGVPVFVWIIIGVGVVVIIGAVGVFFFMKAGASGGKVTFQESLVQDTEMEHGNNNYKQADSNGRVPTNRI